MLVLVVVHGTPTVLLRIPHRRPDLGARTRAAAVECRRGRFRDKPDMFNNDAPRAAGRCARCAPRPLEAVAVRSVSASASAIATVVSTRAFINERVFWA